MAPPLLRTDGVSRTYTIPGGPGLHGVDIEVHSGEFLVLMGASGCGKTTLLNLMGLVDRPDAGEVYFDGQPTSALSDHDRTILRRRRVGYVFQFFHLLPYLTLAENVSLPLLLDGARPAVLHERARELLDRLGLGGRAEDLPHQLSGGQMQRVAIARALAARPALLLADEPTGSLDSATGADILALFRSLAGTGGHTIVMATHSPEAARCGDRVARISDGRLIAATEGLAS